MFADGVIVDASGVDDDVDWSGDVVAGGLAVVAAEADVGIVAGTTPASNANPSSTPSPRRVGRCIWSTR